jgi:hypothetical protein
VSARRQVFFWSYLTFCASSFSRLLMLMKSPDGLTSTRTGSRSIRCCQRLKVWPIVQLSDWGEPMPASQVREALDHGTRRPATGVMVFHCGALREQWDKVEELGRFYRRIGR